MALTKRQEKQVGRLCAIDMRNCALSKHQRRLIYRDLIKMLKKKRWKLRWRWKKQGDLMNQATAYERMLRKGASGTHLM